MFSFLFILISSTWVEYSEDNLADAVQNSTKIPLFVLLHSPACEHCRGIPERIKHFSETVWNTSDLNIMSIDCLNTDGCLPFRITGTPTLKLVVGRYRSFWKNIECNDEECWKTLIEEYLQPEFEKTEENVTPDFDLSDGGAAFHLTVPSEEDTALSDYKKYSKTIKVYHTTLKYSVDPNIKAPKLTVYQKKSCPLVYKGDREGMFDFMIDHKFSVFHNYTYQEFIEFPDKTKFTFYYVLDHATPAMLHNFEELSSNECSDIIYGQVSHKIDDSFLKKLGLTLMDLPVLATMEKGSKCIHIWKKGMNLYKDHYLPNVLKGHCETAEIGVNNVRIPYASILSIVLLVGSICGWIVVKRAPKKESLLL